MTRTIDVPSAGKAFNNRAAYCVGTGRLGLALQKEYLDHLDLVQADIGFKHIRGHGLFCDDVGIYRECELDGKIHPFYNFTYLDRIMDAFLERGIRPFLELGFMPDKLKSGERTVFYWKGNVTPPASWEKWEALVEATLVHLIERYGRDEVAEWPVEVWNEPNIGFWAGTMDQYFELYDRSARVIKRVEPRMKVGGPAICGVETEKWLRAFFEFVSERGSPLDFITRHCYTAETAVNRGHYVYHAVKDPAVMIEELKETRLYMADYPKIAGLPLHITEFNSSYNPLCPVHDTAFHAPYIARILSEAGDYADSYSYWTFSDVFEEADVPKAVFHGGFGLVALGGIKKPTYRTFEFFARAGDELLYRDEHLVVTKKGDRYVVIAWNRRDPAASKPAAEQAEAASKPAAGEADVVYRLKLPAFADRAYLARREVGGPQGDPLRTWSRMGKPRYPSREQLELLRAAAEPARSDAVLKASDGRYEVGLTVAPDRLVLIEIMAAPDATASYLGFDPDQFYGLD
jgi:xylan 1,4-beta-xylosidase